MNRRQFLTGTAAAGTMIMHADKVNSSEQAKLHVPPEEDAHDFTLMQWPVSSEAYEDRYFRKIVRETIADIANAIADFEPVVMLAEKSLHASARKLLSDGVELWDIPTEDLWCRDSGPLIALDGNGQRVVSHIRFNGWGNKQLHKRDGLVAERVAERLAFPVIDSGLVGEAGGVDHDGHGLLIAHESSWIIDNRNPGLDRETVTNRLLAAYGAERMVWSPGLKGEDITDYHIDSLARFTGARRVLINLPRKPDRHDPFHAAAERTHKALEAAGLEVEIIPEPDYRRVDSYDFVASYANYYACNGAIIAAQFGDTETDQIAMDALRRHYPGREVVTLNVDALGEIGGGIHCATQQVPAA